MHISVISEGMIVLMHISALCGLISALSTAVIAVSVCATTAAVVPSQPCAKFIGDLHVCIHSRAVVGLRPHMVVVDLVLMAMQVIYIYGVARWRCSWCHICTIALLVRICHCMQDVTTGRIRARSFWASCAWCFDGFKAVELDEGCGWNMQKECKKRGLDFTCCNCSDLDAPLQFTAQLLIFRIKSDIQGWILVMNICLKGWWNTLRLIVDNKIDHLVIRRHFGKA